MKIEQFKAEEALKEIVKKKGFDYKIRPIVNSMRYFCGDSLYDYYLEEIHQDNKEFCECVLICYLVLFGKEWEPDES